MQLQDLNPEQIKAVKHTEGPLLIVAGAGSGKTRVITQRISYLLNEKGVAPDRILAVTFTNKAAAEMKHRIGAKMPWAGTFHSTCLKILKVHCELLGFKKGFVIFDAGDQLQLMKKIIADLNYDKKQYVPRSVLGTISTAKNELVSVEEYKEKAEDVYQNVVAKAYEKYQQELFQSNAMDFDDLLSFTIKLFNKFPEILNTYQEQFEYVFVDEYQDTNYAQYILTRELAKKYKNICVVGDGDQNIYSWRGADIRNILEFEKDYDNVSTILLEQNYRSSKKILDIANSVIKQNTSRQKKKLWTENDAGINAKYYYAFDQHEEAGYIAGQVKALKRNLEIASYEDMAVFYRTNAQSRVVEEEFLKRDIPYRIVGGIRFYERREVKDIIGYLRVLNNPYDNTSLLRIINTPARGIGKTTVEQLVTTALDRGMSVWDLIQDASNVPDRARNKLGEFIKMIHELIAERDKLTVGKLVDTVIGKSGYRTMLLGSGQEEDLERLDNISELISIADEKEHKLPDFLTEIALMSDLRDWDAQDEAVTLMTLHSAKGLEFPVVFMSGMEEGLLPHFRALFETFQMEEERRLCYVGITRAKEKVFFTSAYQRRVAGDFRNCERSRFLDEIPDEYLDKEESAQLKGTLLLKNTKEEEKAWLEEKTVSYLKSYEKNTDLEFDFKQDDAVNHNMWGEGKIVKVHGSGASMTLEVKFPTQNGVKLIMPKYAPITKV